MSENLYKKTHVNAGKTTYFCKFFFFQRKVLKLCFTLEN